MIKRRNFSAIGLLAMALVCGCSKPGEKDPRLQAPKVETFTVQEAGDSQRAFTGIVEAKVQSDLGFRVGGKIQERCVDVGQRVVSGQPLMRLDPLDLKLSAAAQQANVAAARAKYTQAIADEVRLARLVKADVISPQSYDQVRAILDSAKAELEAVEAQAKVSENSREYTVLRADADGVIVKTLSEPGQVVAAGQPVIQLAHDGPREATINLPEGLRPDPGSVASARVYGQDETYPARLRQLSDAAAPATRTFEARYVLEGDAAHAPLGSTVTVSLVIAQKSEGRHVFVPIGAVYDRGRGPGVWVIDDEAKVRFRPVAIASVGLEAVLLSGGLQPGEKVVALGAHLLHEQKTVNLLSAPNLSHGKL